MFEFITRKSLLYNIVVAIALMIGLFMLFLFSLGFFTRHNETYTVPDIKGKSYSDAKQELENGSFEVAIQDSIYIDTLPGLSVIKQFPEPGSVVKVGRRVYLTVTREVAPMVEMPNLIGVSFRNAEIILKGIGLKVGDTAFRPDFAKNSVLVQSYAGDEIKPGTPIPMGSKVSLILGDGIGNIDFNVPELYGMTFAEAKALIEASGLIIGAVVMDADVKTRDEAYVYRQSPDSYDSFLGVKNKIKPGQLIDVWLSTQKPPEIENTEINEN